MAVVNQHVFVMKVSSEMRMILTVVILALTIVKLAT
jgi:hypothetical protein